MARALSSPLMDDFNATLIARREMRIVATNYYGKRHVTSGSRAVKTVADMQGFKLRVPQVDTFVAMAEAWGAKPTAMDFSELYLALSQGAVDGEENPLPTIQSGKLFEVQKYLVLTGHVITPRLVMVNEPAWKKLSDADRTIVTAAVRASAAWNDAEIAAQEATLADTFTKAGMTVIQPDVESFRKPVLATVPQKFEAKWGKGLFEKLQAM
jgi:TRAP-type C4-dicarboxylate transport system substrate-binding protein